MKRVLIITYYWPPSGGAGVQRWLKFSKYLPDHGWQPVIYTPETQEAPVEDPSLARDIHPATELIRRPIWEPYSFYKKFIGMEAADKVNTGFLSEKERPGRKERLSVWIRGNLFIPDARKFWIRPSVRYLTRYLRHHPVDAVISTGPPHSMHLIALKLKQKTGIPWIADFRDPWTGIDYYDQLRLTRQADRRHHKLEKTVLGRADKTVVVGRSMAAEFYRLNGVQAEVVPNGYDEEDFKGAEAVAPDRFTIVHIGAMNRDRNHDAFWKAVAGILNDRMSGPEIRIRLIGKLDVAVLHSIKKERLDAVVEKIPYLAHDRIASELMSAALLYLPINNTPNAKGIQTGKIFEYIASGRPVLGVGPVDGDAATILEECQAGTMAGFTDKEGIRAAIEKELRRFHSGQVRQSKPCEQFSRENLTKKLRDILDKTKNQQ
jgi:glycosyltransferase involved in cell wall biosynthesis